MRITFFTDTYLPEVNGVTTVVATMRDGLRERGHEIMVLAPAYARPTPAEAGITRLPSVPCPGYGQVRLSWPWWHGLGRKVRAFDPDVIHAVTEGPLGLYGRRWAVRNRRPLATSFHTDFPRYASHYLGPWAVRPVRAWLRWFHRDASVTQTPSVVTRDELLGMGIRRATVWGRGVDSRFFRPDRRSAGRRTAMGLRPDQILVLHVGRLAVEKDVDTLVRAMQLMHAQLGDRVAFCVAGDGPRGDVVRTGLPFARHLGFIQRDALADLYADADVFLFPSPTETCGLVTLEAMASGLPVIGADAGGIPENIRQGITGELVTPGDAAGFAGAVVALADDGMQHHAMRRGARAFAEGRDWRREMDVLETTYERLAEISSAVPAPSPCPTRTSVM